jgi:hypothetical protein
MEIYQKNIVPPPSGSKSRATASKQRFLYTTSIVHYNNIKFKLLICLITHHARKVWGGVELEFHAFSYELKVDGQFQAPGAFPQDKARGTNWTRDWRGSTVRLDTVKKKEILFRVIISLQRQPLWSSAQRSGFDSRRYQIFWEIVGLERCPLSLVSTLEELLERKSNDFSLEYEITVVRICRADHATSLYPQKLALTSPTSGGHSVGIVRSRTKPMELFIIIIICIISLQTSDSIVVKALCYKLKVRGIEDRWGECIFFSFT